MEYLSQPFKLNNSGLESTITISLRLVFMKVCDSHSKMREEISPLDNSTAPVRNFGHFWVLFNGCTSEFHNTKTRFLFDVTDKRAQK